MTTIFDCEWCGEQFMGSTHSNAKNRWCSDYCRKQLAYSSTCEQCGRTVAYSGRRKQPKVCGECFASRNADRNQRIIDAWTEGEPGWLIGKREGMGESHVLATINYYRRQVGMPIPLHRRRDREIWPEVERRWLAGETAPEIAAAVGGSKENIRVMVQRMRKAGIDLPRRRKVPA